MKKIFRKAAAGALTFSLCLASFGGIQGYAAEASELSGNISTDVKPEIVSRFEYAADEPSEYGLIPVRMDVSSVHDEEAGKKKIVLKDGSMKSASSLESRYLSSDYGYITPQKDQGAFSTCVFFASTSVMEANLIKNKIGNHTLSNTNLSEGQTAYYHFHSVTDPLGLIKGDAVLCIGNTNYLTSGSDIIYVAPRLMTWISPHDESTDTVSYSALSDMADRREVTLNEAATVFSQGLPKNSSKVYGTVSAHAQGYSIFNPLKDTNEIKQAIKEYGALTCDFNYSQKYFKGNAVYCNENGKTPNHEVTLIGWDDNYSRNNFATDPGEDGAWIVRNSWGTAIKADDVVDEQGNTYISYADKSFLSEYNHPTAIRMEEKNNYKYNYQYDGSAPDADIHNLNKYINIFKTQGNKAQTIEAVGVGVGSANTSFKIEIYKNVKVSGSKISGKKISSASTNGTIAYEGFETIKLKSPVKVNPGEKYGVAVIPDDTSKGFNLQINDENEGFINKTKAGQSFCVDSKGDYSDLSLLDASVSIKAYANDYTGPITDISSAKISLKNKSVTYNGKVRKPVISSVTMGNSKLYDSDYTVKITNSAGKTISPKKAGKYKVSIKGFGLYKGTAATAYVIKPAASRIKVNGKTVSKARKFSIKRASIRKKARVFKVTRTGSGKISMKNRTRTARLRKYLKYKNGKVTLKKNAPRGTYSFTVTVAKTANYKKTTSKTVTVKVK